MLFLQLLVTELFLGVGSQKLGRLLGPLHHPDCPSPQHMMLQTSACLLCRLFQLLLRGKKEDRQLTTIFPERKHSHHSSKAERPQPTTEHFRKCFISWFPFRFFPPSLMTGPSVPTLSLGSPSPFCTSLLPMLPSKHLCILREEQS